MRQYSKNQQHEERTRRTLHLYGSDFLCTLIFPGQPTRVALERRTEADAEEVNGQCEPHCLARDRVCDERARVVPHICRCALTAGSATNILSSIGGAPSFGASGTVSEKGAAVALGGQGMFRFIFFFFSTCAPGEGAGGKRRASPLHLGTTAPQASRKILVYTLDA